MGRKLKRRYGTIEKVTPLEDGTLEVEGVMSSETEDSDGETIAAEAVKAALPGYMKFGAVREMHGSDVAAGTALRAEVNKDRVTEFCAHVVDEDAIRKVNAKVYKGFSLGANVLARDPLNKKRITRIDLIEVSLVDRPANPDAVFTMYKSAKLDGGTDLAKSMFHVSWACDLLDRLASLQECVANEAGWEGDGSHIPAALKMLVEDLVVAVREMLDEEAGELLARADAQLAALAAEDATMAEKATKLEEVADRLAKAAGVLEEKLGLGGTTDLQKAVARVGELETALKAEKEGRAADVATKDAEIDTLKKAAVVADASMTEATSVITDLQKRAGPALRVVPTDKSVDGEGAAGDKDKVKKDATPTDLIKAAHAKGGTIVDPRNVR